MGDEALFYVQDKRQHVGNCVLWWAKDRCGYTCHLDKAGLYTATECKGMRDTDVPWPRAMVEEAASLMVDMQKLRGCGREGPPT